MPEGEEEEQEIENLFEKIMKENFPNLVNEIDTQNILMVTDGRFVGGLGEEGEGIKKYELIVPE